MNDMTRAIEPRSDQLNSDDLIAGPRTITISRVEIRPSPEQPVSIFFDGDNGKPWKPCKSMSRVLVAAWGPDAKAYVGRSVTLYRDPGVTWGGMAVGGIRISHISHVDGDLKLALTLTKGKKGIATIKKLDQPATEDRAARWTADFISWRLDNLSADLSEADTKAIAKLRRDRPELAAQIDNALSPQPATASGDADPSHEAGGVAAPANGDFAEKRGDEDMGEKLFEGEG